MSFNRTTHQMPQAILEPEQIEYRNKHYRNWGTYKVFKWKHGHPQWYISSCNFFIYKVLPIPCVFVFCFTVLYKFYERNEIDTEIYKIIVLICLTILTLVSMILFYRKDPNISSTILPITDEAFMRYQANFCSPCKLFKQSQHHHCLVCKVCLKNQYFHSVTLGSCITSGNFKEFILICLSIMLFSAYALLI